MATSTEAITHLLHAAGTTRLVPDPPRRVNAGTQRWMLFAALTAAAIVAYYQFPRAGVGQAVLLTSVNAASALAAWRRARHTQGRTRVVWAALGSAMVFSTLANGPYYAYPLVTGSPVPFPCPVDVLWLLTYPCYVVALLALGGNRRGGRQLGDLVDSAILTVGAGTIMWLFIIGPSIEAPTGSTLAHVVSIAYPAMDLVVFAALARLIVAGLHRNGASRLLLGSFVALLVADMVYAVALLNGTYAFGGPTDGLWIASYALIGIAAMHPESREFPANSSGASPTTQTARLVFLSVSVLIGPFLLVIDGDEVPLLAGASALSFLLVMSRLTGLNRRLASVSRELEHQAFHDALTGLANRALFDDRVEQSHRRLTRSALRYAVLVLDLDGFKSVNDRFGHSAGDELLVEVSKRLSDGLRPGDTAARLGGDEFGVILEDLQTESEAMEIADRVLDSLRPPTTIAGRSLIIGATIGIALPSATTTVADDVVRNADIALYVAKAAGKDRRQLYGEGMHNVAHGQLALAQELRDGLSRGELVLDYQPKVDAASGRMVGVEALVRWNHPVRGTLLPDDFIAMSETSGLIKDVDGWVIATACRQVISWDALDVGPLTIAVNISARDLEGSWLIDRIRAVLAETGLDPRRLELELTESTAVEQTDTALSLLTQVRALGVRIAIDDFGTGYSMLSRLQDLPVDTIKIDRCFVTRITGRDADSPIVSASVAMARGLGLEVVAEGVETEAQRRYLVRQGCELLQGYLVSRPVAADRIPQLVRATLVAPIEDPRWGALDSALGVAAAAPAGDALARGLLVELQRLTGHDAVYVSRINWAAGEQVILFSHNRGPRIAPEGLVLPWPNTLSHSALTTSPPVVTHDAAAATPADAAPDQSFISVPLLLDDGTMFGTLCGASEYLVPMAPSALQVMRIFASILAAELSGTAALTPAA